jgi:hypothetical protein
MFLELDYHPISDACMSARRDSHARFFYRALQCFLLDFWDHQECQSTLDDEANAQLAKMPAAPGGAYCFHLLGAATGRVCMVHVVLGTSLVDNPEVGLGFDLFVLPGRCSL